ncbi:Plasmodium variant antigen protein Cir/Yir/Bir, putative, partial [Plasmodium chabaudi chabaudi]
CEFLIEADGYFNDKNVDTEEINKHLTIKGYCYNDGCKTNEDSINALTTYIFKEFKKSIKNDKYNEYDECFLMWLSDKLFKIHIESKGKKNVKNYMDGTTLNQAYENYLKSYKVKLGYWDFFDNIKGLKEANLKYMIEFYKLLNNICKTITDYETNGAESRKLSKYSKNCLNQYRILYNNISECKSYVRLLNKLKGIYDDFRNYAIKETSSNNNLETKLQKLTREDGVEMNAVRSFKPYKFIKKKCNSLDKKNAKPKKTDPPGLPPSSKKESLPPKAPLKQDTSEPAPPSPQETQPETQQSSSTASPEDPPAKLELHSSSQESQKTGESDQNEPKGSGKETGGSKSEINSPEVGNEKKNGEDKEPGTPSGEEGSQVNGGDSENSEPGGADTEKGGPEGGSADKVSETGDHGNGKGASKGETGDISGGDQGSPGGGASGGQDSHPGTVGGADIGTSGDAGSPGIVAGGTGGEGLPAVGSSGIGNAAGDQGKSPGGLGGSGSIQGATKSGTGSALDGKGDTGDGAGTPISEPGDGQGTDANGPGGAGVGQGGISDLQDGHGSQEGSSGDKVSQDGPVGDKGSQDGSVGDKGSQDGQDDQKSPDGSGDSETGPGSEQNPTDSAPREKETQNASWPLFDIRSYIYTIASKGMEQLNNAFKFYNENKEKIKEAIDTINSLYNTSVSNLKNTFTKFIEVYNNFINNLCIDSKKVETPPDSGNNPSGSGGTGDDPPTPNDPSQPQKDSDKQDSQTTQIPENSKEQTQVQKSSQDPSENQNSDQTDQERTQKQVQASATKQENPGTELKGNGIAGIGDVYVLKEYKKIGISIIVILIP